MDVTTVAVCGCNFPNCSRATIYEVSERDFQVAAVTDATSGLYERGLRELENIGVEPVSVDGVSEKLVTGLSGV